MKKNVDLTKLSDVEIKKQIKILKNKSQLKEEFGKLTFVTSLIVGFFALFASGMILVPALIVAGVSLGGIIASWGLVSSSIDCDKQIKNLTKELDNRSQEHNIKYSKDKTLHDAHKPNLIKRSQEKVQEDNTLEL